MAFYYGVHNVAQHLVSAFGGKRTSLLQRKMSAYDPKRTWRDEVLSEARGATYLIAAVEDPQHGVDPALLSQEARDSFARLREDLDALKPLTPYRQDDGRLAI
jgi:hypothetical protein